MAVQVIFVEGPATVDVGVQETSVVEVLLVTDRANVPEDREFFASPPYLAVMVTGELADVGVYFTEHAPPERLQEFVENDAEPLLDHVTSPVGEEPVIVAVHVIVDPTSTVVRVQFTVVVVFVSADTIPSKETAREPETSSRSNIKEQVDRPLRIGLMELL